MAESPAKDRKKRISSLQIVGAGLLLLFGIQTAVNYAVLGILQKRLELRVTGNFWPVPFQSSLFSNNAGLEWKNRITILSGKLKIDYNALPLLYKNSIRIRLHGENISARLSGDWKKMQGVEKAAIDTLDADLEIAGKGLGEIYRVHAQSPSFQFHIEKTDT